MFAWIRLYSFVIVTIIVVLSLFKKCSSQLFVTIRLNTCTIINRKSSYSVRQYTKEIAALSKGLRALRGYFGPPMRSKNEIRFSPNSFCWFIRTMTQVYKSDISLTFTVAMVKKLANKTG